LLPPHLRVSGPFLEEPLVEPQRALQEVAPHVASNLTGEFPAFLCGPTALLRPTGGVPFLREQRPVLVGELSRFLGAARDRDGEVTGTERAAENAPETRSASRNGVRGEVLLRF